MSSLPLSLRPEVLAFLADIKEHPGDDTPRLILADWLQDQGDPRGEFIRLQCQLARRPADRASQPPEERLGQLLAQHRDAWLGPLADMALGVSFERGLLRLLVASTAVTAGDLDAVAETTAWSQGQVIYLDPAATYIAGGGVQALGQALDRIIEGFGGGA